MKERVLIEEKTALLVVDIQEAFLKSIPGLKEVIDRTETVIRAFDTLNRPILITEQYPKGLGHTVDALRGASGKAEYFEKSSFSACGAGGFRKRLEDDGVSTVLVAGIETHVCVNQTVHDLLETGFNVHVLEDAVESRSASDRDTALKKMYLSGAVPSTVEMALFEMLNGSDSPHFKKIQSLIK